MTVIGFHCSHEQIAPAQLLCDVQHAEQAEQAGSVLVDLLDGRTEHPLDAQGRVELELGPYGCCCGRRIHQSSDVDSAYNATKCG